MDSAFSTNMKQAISQGMRVFFFLLLSHTAIFPLPSNYDAERPVYYFEFLTFSGVQGEETFLEIFSQIPTKNLQFIKCEEGFYASYEASITLHDGSNIRVNVMSYIDSVKVPSLDDIYTLAKPHVIRFSCLVPAGEYKAKFRLTDLETLSVTTFSKKIVIPNYRESGLKLSDLQIASSITASEENSVLVKNNRKIVPNVPRAFGMGLDTVYVYSEVYNLSYKPKEITKEFLATYTIKNDKGKIVKSVPLSFKKPADTCVLSVGIPVHKLQSGQYEIILNVIDQDNKQSTEKSTHFNIMNPSNELSDLDINKLISQLRFIASSQELQELKSLPANERLTGFSKFWVERDPTPDTKLNEIKNEYYRRIIYANEYYSNPWGQGWETDQGAVYIKIGSPGYIDRFQTAFNNTTYEIWEYFKLGRKYTFIDTEGFGQFRLMNPLKTMDLESTLY